MRLLTIPEAARILGIPAQMLRRYVRSGRYPSYDVDGRTLVDVDELVPLVMAERATIGIKDAAELTGLSEKMLRRGAKGGWLPCEKIGNAYRFVPAQLLAALEGRKKND